MNFVRSNDLVWNIKGLHHIRLERKGLENLILWQRILYLHTTKCILYVCIDIFFHSYFNFKFKICLTYHERLKLNYLQQKVWKREYERSSFNGRKLRLTDNQYPQLTLIWFRQEINFLVFFKKTYMMQNFNPIWNLLEINVRRSQKHEGI